MFDQRMLMSIKKISTKSQTFSFIAARQSYFFRANIHKAKHMRMVKNIRSNGLPDSGSPANDRNHWLRGLLEIRSIQIVGIHRVRVISGDCLRSRPSINSTKAVQRISASVGSNIFTLNEALFTKKDIAP